jgi:predicted lipoprotein with Yx(FWY)xxD motif
MSAGDGVDAALLGTAARDDGSQQATYNGWPLYYFGADTAAGDTNGQGVNDVWFAISARGDAVQN